MRSSLNLEMAATDEMVQIAIATGPDSVTLVPERREEVTTEGGLDVAGTWSQLTRVVARLADAGIVVNAFIDPETAQVEASAEAKFHGVELHTGSYANSHVGAAGLLEIERIGAAAALGARRNLIVAAGHGLDYVNVKPVVHILRGRGAEHRTFYRLAGGARGNAESGRGDAGADPRGRSGAEGEFVTARHATHGRNIAARRRK